MDHLRRCRRTTTSYKDEFSPCYPDGKPADEFERRIASLDQQSFPWEQFSTVDDVLVYALFSTKRRPKGYRAVKTQRAFGEEEPLVTPEEGIEIRRIYGTVRELDQIPYAAQAMVTTFPQIFSQEQRPVIQHLLHRYHILYSAESPVTHEKVSFDGTMISLGLKARRAIPAGCPILSTSTSLSLDLVPHGMSGISIIEASSGQKGPLGRRVMLGPLRFANQDCQPNSQIRSVANSYAYMLWSIAEIKEGESITVQYRKDGAYFAGKCACASCHPNNPPVAPHRLVMSASGSGEGGGDIPTLKRKTHRGGRRKRNKRLREWEELDTALEELDRAAEGLP